MSRPTLLTSETTPRALSVFPTCPLSRTFPHPQTLKLHRKFTSLSSVSVSFSFQSTFPHKNLDGDFEEERVIGDCVVFEDGVFEDPYLQDELKIDAQSSIPEPELKSRSKNKKKVTEEIQAENLVPDQWREAQAELNITKKDRRKLAYELEFGRRVERKKQGLVPLRNLDLNEYLSYKEAKLRQLKPVVLDTPSNHPVKEEDVEKGLEEGRVAPKNPRWAVYGKGLEDVSEFFNSGNYEPSDKKSEGPRKLFTNEEKILLNRGTPNLSAASSGKWLPLHTLAASAEFYLMNVLLKQSIDINAVDKDGLTALHKAIVCKRQAIINYLLRESANPFVVDKEGATLMHYAVRTASSQTVKILLLYNVDINLQDNDGWTPLHLAVQARRTDLVRLLLIKGADKTLKNRDGLTPLDICLHSGRGIRTYELIKLLKQLPKARKLL